MSATLQALFSDRFERFADRTAIEEADGRTWSYRNLKAGMLRAAGALRARGVSAGERVLAQTDKSVEALLAYFACHHLGAVYVPLNTDYTKAELDYFIADAQPKIALCRAQSRAVFEAIAAARAPLAVETLETLGAAPPPPPAAVGPDDLAAILYTSGTTGRSKGAMLSHANLASNALTLIEAWRFSPADTLIHALPIFHIHGLFVAVHCAVLSGAKMLFLPRFDAAAVIGAMARATVLMGVPTFYTRLLDDPALTREAARGMRLFVAGSAPLSAETFRAFETRTGARVLERYGMTETGMLASNPYEGARVPGSVGLPLPGVSLRIAGQETGAALPRGEIGIVEAKGANVFKGYWRNPEKTAAEFRPDGYFITGDMGRFDENGYLHLVGRAKDLIICGGLNVYPKEIESALEGLAGVAEAAVIGVPHPDFGEAVVAAIVPAAGGAVDPQALRGALREQLAGFKVPKQIFVLDAFPRNAMGKVQKNALRERYRHLFATSSP